MEPKSTICGITQAEPVIIVSSFKLSSGTTAYPGFVPELDIYREKNLRLVGFH